VSRRVLKIGTRGSKLAMEQARRVAEKLPGPSQVTVVRTSGDRFKDIPLAEQSGIGFFTKEIENELLAKNIDLAVHSLKDLPTGLAPGLRLAAILERDEASDLLLIRPDAQHRENELPLKNGSRVGASAMRRKALLKVYREDLIAAPIRGNVPTRVDKARHGDYDAVILSRAGLARLAYKVDPLLAFDLNPRRWICAPGQGVIAVEARAEDEQVLQRLAGLDHMETRACVTAERALLVTFGGGCHAPFGAWARRQDDDYQVMVAAPGNQADYQVEHFRAGSLDQAQKQAEQWIRAGCPAISNEKSQEWICRPARPWC